MQFFKIDPALTMHIEHNLQHDFLGCVCVGVCVWVCVGGGLYMEVICMEFLQG